MFYCKEIKITCYITQILIYGMARKLDIFDYVIG